MIESRRGGLAGADYARLGGAKPAVLAYLGLEQALLRRGGLGGTLVGAGAGLDVRAPVDGVWLVRGDAAALLPALAAVAPRSVDAVVTSPPYLWKRRYGDDPEELGQDPTPERFVARLVALFRPLQALLVPQGVLLVNLGDSYFNDFGGGSATMTSGNAGHVQAMGRHRPPPHPQLPAQGADRRALAVRLRHAGGRLALAGGVPLARREPAPRDGAGPVHPDARGRLALRPAGDGLLEP